MNQASLAGFSEIVQLSDRRYGRTKWGNLVYVDNIPAPTPAPQEPETKFPVETGKAAIDSAIANLSQSEVKSETEEGHVLGNGVSDNLGTAAMLAAIS